MNHTLEFPEILTLDIQIQTIASKCCPCGLHKGKTAKQKQGVRKMKKDTRRMVWF